MILVKKTTCITCGRQVSNPCRVCFSLPSNDTNKIGKLKHTPLEALDWPLNPRYTPVGSGISAKSTECALIRTLFPYVGFGQTSQEGMEELAFARPGTPDDRGRAGFHQPPHRCPHHPHAPM